MVSGCGGSATVKAGLMREKKVLGSMGVVVCGLRVEDLW